MEDTLQRFFAILVAVVIFFLLPLYIAFEKKDDISYSLALKITSNFVNDVKNKGYITRDMYNDFISDLAVTGNSYDIKMEHVAKKYYPVIYSYNNGFDKDYTNKFDYSLYKELYESNPENMKIGDVTYTNLILGYELSEERITEKQILLDLENKIQNPDDGFYEIDGNKAIYPMGKGDEFTVIVKNTNTTIATILFNTLTFGANNENTTKVYINYGGTIQNEEYNTTELETATTSAVEDIDYIKTGLMSWLDGEYNTIQGHDTSTTVWNDLSGNNNNALILKSNTGEVPQNSIWKTKKTGLTLEGTTTWVNCGRLEDIIKISDGTNSNGTMTLEFTFETNTPGEQNIIGNARKGGFSVYKNAANKLVVQYKTESDKQSDNSSGTDRYTSIVSSSVISTNQKYSVTITYDGNKLTAYLNGNVIGSVSGKMYNTEDNSILTIGTLPIGGSSDESKRKLNGTVYVVRLYNRVLSSSDIKSNYKIDKQRFIDVDTNN